VRIVLAVSWIVLLTGALACATGAPEIATDGMEPAVVELIEARRSQLDTAPSAETWGALGDSLLAHGLESEAADCYARAVGLSDDPFEWLYLQGLATTGDGAFDLFLRALELQPDHALVELRLALGLQQSTRHQEAERWFELAALHDPSLQRALRGLGQSRLALERPADAIQALEQALTDDPKDASGWSALAQAYTAVGREDRAREALSHARRGDERPGFSDPIWLHHVLQNGVSAARRFERAQYALADGDVEAAREHTETILRSRPEDADANYLLGLIELASGNEQEALGQFERALESNPDHVRALLSWATSATRVGRLDEARLKIERAGSIIPEDPSIVLALAENRRHAKDLNGMLEAYLRLVELAPESPRAWLNLGTLHERRRQPELAIDAYRRAVALDPASPAATRLESLDR
jgi:tetratricopeptide (TPR) repeat protein